jgi:hypothetical protein
VRGRSDFGSANARKSEADSKVMGSCCQLKNTPQGELKVGVYLPEGWQSGQKHSTILMFFGGGFTNGTPAQFRSKAEYLSSRGIWFRG